MKAELPPGVWQDEPDKEQWIDKETGLPCLLVRSFSGALCGYVGVSRNHPAYKKDWDDVEVEVHGGLTFAAKCDPSPNARICHVVEDGEDDKVWWLGFDCAHAFDISPNHLKLFGGPLGLQTYKDVDFVKNECASLAKQLKNYPIR